MAHVKARFACMTRRPARSTFQLPHKPSPESREHLSSSLTFLFAYTTSNPKRHSHASEGYQERGQRAYQDSTGKSNPPLRIATRRRRRSHSLTPWQKTKVEAKAAATPSKTTKQFPNKEGSTTITPKKKEPAKVTKLALNKAATLPITVTFQGDNPEAKHTKAGYTHALKLDASAHFSLVDSVSL